MQGSWRVTEVSRGSGGWRRAVPGVKRNVPPRKSEVSGVLGLVGIGPAKKGKVRALQSWREGVECVYKLDGWRAWHVQKTAGHCLVHGEGEGGGCCDAWRASWGGRRTRDRLACPPIPYTLLPPTLRQGAGFYPQRADGFAVWEIHFRVLGSGSGVETE